MPEGAPSTTRKPVIVAVVVALLAVTALAVWLQPRPTSGAPAVVADDGGPQLGRRIYANCQACHGIDGLGVAGYAPSLVLAPTLMGDGRAAVAKILTGGRRDGFNSVMPSFARLSDAEIVAVMDYTRSSWGNQGAAVTVEAVATVRRETPVPAGLP